MPRVDTPQRGRPWGSNRLTWATEPPLAAHLRAAEKATRQEVAGPQPASDPQPSTSTQAGQQAVLPEDDEGMDDTGPEFEALSRPEGLEAGT